MDDFEEKPEESFAEKKIFSTKMFSQEEESCLEIRKKAQSDFFRSLTLLCTLNSYKKIQEKTMILKHRIDRKIRRFGI